MLAGFETPTLGEISIEGQVCTHVPPNVRPTNLVFQSYALFPHLSVAENVAYGLRTRKLSKDEQWKIVADCIALVKLGELAHRRPHQLSGGQRQRVALARALARQPKVLLLDEPLSALDKQLREEMQLELRSLQRRVGITFILVTHDQEEALTMSDRIAVMSRGKVLQLDDPARLYEAPVSREVAAFIGNMNFLSGRINGIESGGATVDVGLSKPLVARHDAATGARKGDAVIMAVRPEKISIGEHSSAIGKGMNELRGKLITSTYLGDRNHLFVKVVGLEKPIALAMQNSHRMEASNMAVSDDVVLSWSAEDSLLLPPSGPWPKALQ
jgi:spermidine/putrescine transport system ATP-binding protein/putrescine transport system ATP-binding protein